MAVEPGTGLGRLVLASAMAWALLAPGLSSAQSPPAAVPETRQMIDALKPAASRGMRNLLVRQTPDVGGPAAAAGDAVGVVAPPAVAPTLTPAPAATAIAALARTEVAAPAPIPSLSLAIQFDVNSARVRPESGAVLGNLVAALMSPDLKANRFVIEGHTDGRGVPAANWRLSQQRADEVRLYLVALGVHPARLKAVGKGSSEPADPRDPMSADNRRVRVVTVE